MRTEAEEKLDRMAEQFAIEVGGNIGEMQEAFVKTMLRVMKTDVQKFMAENGEQIKRLSEQGIELMDITSRLGQVSIRCHMLALCGSAWGLLRFSTGTHAKEHDPQVIQTFADGIMEAYSVEMSSEQTKVFGDVPHEMLNAELLATIEKLTAHKRN